MKYEPEKIGKTIAELRKKQNWTQRQLGIAMGFNKKGQPGKQISNYEKGITIPPIDILFKLCDVFDCELGYLLGEPNYSDGTRIETAIHNATGLTKEAMDAIRLLTGKGKDSPSFGYESEEYRALFNRFLTSKQFPNFMDEMRHLDDAFKKHESIVPDMYEEIGENRVATAMNLILEVEGLPDDLCPEITQQEIDDMHLVQEAYDEKNSLAFRIKILRYEAREAFESLLMDLYPRRRNE